MKREEKNLQTRRRIMDSALNEFSKQGYGASSINTICSAQGISKGIIYHYFKTKDDLFLACVEECFCLLTEYLRSKMQDAESDTERQLEEYFAVRMSFFTEYPIYQRIFCEVMITPPTHLETKIQECRKNFDQLNIQILDKLLAPLSLRPPITKGEVIETFRQFQDFINIKYPVTEFEAHEQSCKRALNILLYGVIDRREQKS